MSYSEQRKGFSPASIGTVVAVHAAIGYAFISGLAYQVIQTSPLVTAAILLPDPKVPPPNMPPPQARPTPTAQPAPVERIVEMPLTLSQPTLDQFPLTRPVFDPPTETIAQPSQPKPAAILTRGATPQGDRASWVTTDDYPTAALREGMEGAVGIDVAIDERGRVSGCTVSATSGSALLDKATCLLYARRARFTPALDEGGKPVATHRADRVRWQIPR